MLLLEMLLFMASTIPLSFASKFQKQITRKAELKYFAHEKNSSMSSLPTYYLFLIMIQEELLHTNGNKHSHRSQQGSNSTAGKQTPRRSRRQGMTFL